MTTKYEPGAIKRGPEGQVAVKTRLEDGGPGGVQSWIEINPETTMVQHRSTSAVSNWEDVE